MFTDGACSGNPGPGGWGTILRTGEHEKELSGGERATTNNRMELTAVIRGLEALKRRLPKDVLVLPGHNLPFVGLGARADELMAHHEARCVAILEACKQGPQTVAELVPVIFGRRIDDPHQLVFAFSEALAHVNILVGAGRLRIARAAQGLALEAA